MTPTLNPREDALAKIIREEIVRQYRDDERGRCPAGAHYYEEHIGPWNIARTVLSALSAPPSQSENFLTGYGHQVSQWTEAAVAEQAARSTAAFTSPTPYVRPAESAVVLTLIDALTGLESSYEEGEGVSYARLEARSAIKTAQDFLAAPAPYVRPATAEELAERLDLSGRPNLAFDLIIIEAFARVQYDRGRADEMMAQRLANYTSGSYARPPAEIRAEIERESRTAWTSYYSRGYIAGLTFALTPLITEKETK